MQFSILALFGAASMVAAAPSERRQIQNSDVGQAAGASTADASSGVANGISETSIAPIAPDAAPEAPADPISGLLGGILGGGAGGLLGRSEDMSEEEMHAMEKIEQEIMQLKEDLEKVGM